MVISKDLPSSLVQLRNAVWTGDTRDTMPEPDIGPLLFHHLVNAHGEKYLRYELSLAYAFLISYTKGCLI
jgi:hypothetical protein